jgi:dolichol-phosphate mannosyltransferase
VSVVIPLFDEQEVLPLLVARLRPALDGLGRDQLAVGYELLFVDDGSRDRTVEVVRELAASWPEARLVELRRNAGQQLAIAAGLSAARGDVVITMDADLQDPPELIPDMVRAHVESGVAVVYTCRSDRSSDGWLKSRAADLYYRLIRRLAGVPVQPHVGDFRLMSREVVETLNALPERNRIHRLLLPWLNYPSCTLHHTRERRPAGKTHYSVPRLVRLTADSIVGFTTVPLRWATALGLLTALLSFALTAVAVIAHFSGISISGWASLAGMVSFIGGVQLVCTGILGEYLGRVFIEVQHRPAFDIARISQPAADGSPPSPLVEEVDPHGP